MRHRLPGRKAEEGIVDGRCRPPMERGSTPRSRVRPALRSGLAWVPGRIKAGGSRETSPSRSMGLPPRLVREGGSVRPPWAWSAERVGLAGAPCPWFFLPVTPRWSSRGLGSSIRARLAAACTIVPRSRIDGAVGDAQDHLRVLLDDDRRHAFVAHDARDQRAAAPRR